MLSFGYESQVGIISEYVSQVCCILSALFFSYCCIFRVADEKFLNRLSRKQSDALFRFCVEKWQYI